MNGYRFLDIGVDAIFFCDDQAIQTGPLFSMETWRGLFKPRYQKLCSLAHQAGCKVYMHACGDISQHFPELADAGIDIIDNKQPSLWMHSPAVDEVRGKMCFSSCLDIQSVMGTVELDRIPQEVSSLVRRLSVEGGGFIGTYYHQPDLRIAAEKNTKMLESFKKLAWPKK